MNNFGSRIGSAKPKRIAHGVSNGNRYNICKTTYVAQQFIGLVIGHGGSKIKEISAKFDVNIKINDSTKDITVKGRNSENVDAAIKFIHEFVSGMKKKHILSQDRKDVHNSNDEFKENSVNHDNISNNSWNTIKATADVQVGNPVNRENGGNILSSPRGCFNFGSTENEPPLPLPRIDWEALNIKCEEHRKLQWAQLPELKKNFYEEMEEVSNMTLEEVNELRFLNNEITVSCLQTSEDQMCVEIPKPISKFEYCFKDYPEIMAEIRKQNFSEPSPIQKQAWPILLSGHDLIGIAQTGTGKTLAYLLPALIHTDGQPIPRAQRNGPNILILAPTRELALQIEKEVNKYSFRGIKSVCIYGGASRRDQISAFEKGAECVICTPGRLNDLVQAKVIDITAVTFLILDEADRMLDMGFEPQIRKILLDIRPDRQTVMTSATWPSGVRRLACSYMDNPIQVWVGSLDLSATHTVKQIVQFVEESEKYKTTLTFLKDLKPNDKVIIFCARKARADDLSSDLSLSGLFTQCIHSSREQSDREKALTDFASGNINILIATDVASRGLDIDDITFVINFDFPKNIEEYVHRVGRTGRAGRSGTSISYIARSDWKVAKDLIRILEEAAQEVPEELRKMAKRFDNMKKRFAEENKRFGRFSRP